MDYFLYRDRELYAEEIAVKSIVERYHTPCYIYSQQTLERHWRAIDEVFQAHPHQICYAVKANGNLALLKILADLGSGFDIVSGGELTRVLEAGADPKKIVFSGVGKTCTEIKQALIAGIGVFNVESIPELKRINALALELGRIAPVAVRVNPDVKTDTHHYIATGLQSNKFGIDKDAVISVYQMIEKLPGLKALGIACHIGSQILDLKPFQEALQIILDLLSRLDKQNIKLEHVDLGGGLGVAYDQETPPSLASYAELILKTLKEKAPYQLKLYLEPGRVIAANAGILVSKVEYLKETQAKTFAILDAGMNDLMRPALYEAYHRILPVQESDAPKKTLDLVGPVCESSDFLGVARELAIEAGDLIAIRSAGAYGFSMSSQYNARMRCAEILVNKTQVSLIRSRETMDDLLRNEYPQQPFVKLQALGNDFVLLDLDQGSELWSSEKIQRLSNRHTGIGFDQLLTLSQYSENSFDYRIYNADGTEVEQCGNGARAAALYLKLKHKIDLKRDIQLKTCTQVMSVRCLPENQFSVKMGPAEFFKETLEEFIFEQQAWEFRSLSVGNPHAVFSVPNIDAAPVLSLAPLLMQDRRFPQGVNVGFMQIVDAHCLRLRVYERGAGETQACGSGACAAAVTAMAAGLCQSPVTVILPGGRLSIEWTAGHSIQMQGEAAWVYEGFV